MNTPEGWREATVAELVDPNRRVTYGIVQPGPRQDEGVGIPLIRGQDYSAGTLASEGLYWVLPEVAAAYRRSIVQSGDLLLSIVGYVGIIAEVPPVLTGANITQTTARIAVRSGISSRFLLHYFRGQSFRKEVDRFTKGSAQPGLNLADVERMRVTLPIALPEQRTIAGVLDILDDAILKSEQFIAKLQQVKQGLLYDLLTRGVDDNGELRDPERQPEQFQDSPLGRIPKSWKVAPFAAYGSKCRPYLKTGPFGSSLKQEHWVSEGVPVITIGSLGEGAFIKPELLYITENTARALSAYAVVPGDIVFSRVADVGRSVVVGNENEGWVMSSNLMWISVDQQRAVPEAVQAQIAMNAAVRRQIGRLVNAGGREVANAAVMNALQLPWPSFVEQQHFAVILRNADLQVKVELAALRKLQTIKAGLTEDLLSGRVRTTSLAELTP